MLTDTVYGIERLCTILVWARRWHFFMLPICLNDGNVQLLGHLNSKFSIDMNIWKQQRLFTKVTLIYT